MQLQHTKKRVRERERKKEKKKKEIRSVQFQLNSTFSEKSLLKVEGQRSHSIRKLRFKFQKKKLSLVFFFEENILFQKDFLRWKRLKQNLPLTHDLITDTQPFYERNITFQQIQI